MSIVVCWPDLCFYFVCVLLLVVCVHFLVGLGMDFGWPCVFLLFDCVYFCWFAVCKVFVWLCILLLFGPRVFEWPCVLFLFDFVYCFQPCKIVTVGLCVLYLLPV